MANESSYTARLDFKVDNFDKFTKSLENFVKASTKSTSAMSRSMKKEISMMADSIKKSIDRVNSAKVIPKISGGSYLKIIKEIDSASKESTSNIESYFEKMASKINMSLASAESSGMILDVGGMNLDIDNAEADLKSMTKMLTQMERHGVLADDVIDRLEVSIVNLGNSIASLKADGNALSHLILSENKLLESTQELNNIFSSTKATQRDVLQVYKESSAATKEFASNLNQLKNAGIISQDVFDNLTASLRLAEAELSRMSMAEPISLKINGNDTIYMKELKKELSSIQAEYKKAKSLFDNGDTAGFLEINDKSVQDLKKLSAYLDILRKNGKITEKTFQKFTQMINGTGNSFNTMASGVSKVQVQLLKLSVALKRVSALFEVARRSAGKFVDSASRSLYKMTFLMSQIVGKVQGVVLAFGGLYAGREALKVVDDMDQLDITLKKVSSSLEDYKENWSFVKDFAKTTPASFQTATDAFVKLKAYGLDPTDGSLRAVSDAMAVLGGDSQTMTNIVRALGQIQAKGRVMSQELRQLADANIPVFEILNKKLGLTKEQIADIGNYNVSASEGIQAIVDGMNEAFGGAAIKKMQTLSGRFINLKDQIALVIRELASSGGATDYIKNELYSLTEYFSNLAQNETLLKEYGKKINYVLKSIVNGVKKAFNDIRDQIKSIADSSLGKALANVFDLAGADLSDKIAFLAKAFVYLHGVIIAFASAAVVAGTFGLIFGAIEKGTRILGIATTKFDDLTKAGSKMGAMFKKLGNSKLFTILGLGGKTVGKIVGKFAILVKTLAEVITTMGKVSGVLSENYSGFNLITDAIRYLLNVFVTFLDTFSSGVSFIAKSVGALIGGFASGNWSGAFDVIKQAWNDMANSGTKAIKALAGQSDEGTKEVNSNLGTMRDDIKSTISTINNLGENNKNAFHLAIDQAQTKEEIDAIKDQIQEMLSSGIIEESGNGLKIVDEQAFVDSFNEMQIAVIDAREAVKREFDTIKKEILDVTNSLSNMSDENKDSFIKLIDRAQTREELNFVKQQIDNLLNDGKIKKGIGGKLEVVDNVSLKESISLMKNFIKEQERLREISDYTGGITENQKEVELNFDEFQEDLDDMVKLVEKQKVAIKVEFEEGDIDADEYVQKISGAYEGLENKIRNARLTHDQFQQSMAKVASLKAQDSIAAYSYSLDKIKKNGKKTADALKKVKKEIEDLEESSKSFNDVVNQALSAGLTDEEKLDKLEDTINLLDDQSRKQEGDLNKALEEEVKIRKMINDGILTGDEASNKLAANYKKQVELADKLGRSQADLLTKRREYNSAVEDADDKIDLTNYELNLQRTQGIYNRAVGNVEDYQEKTKSALEKQKDNFDDLEKKVEATISRLKVIMSQASALEVDPTFKTDGVDSMISKVKELQDELKKANAISVSGGSDAYQTGGLVGSHIGAGVKKFSTGGHLPGYGGGDRIKAMLESGEFVMRKEAVRKFGVGFMANINNLKVPDVFTQVVRPSDSKEFKITIGDATIKGTTTEDMLNAFETSMRRQKLAI